jgi:hypothetical protein
MDQDNSVEGSAAEFCQVVTQVRNIADTKMRVVGPAAAAWMSIAQCFAGPPEDPPPLGTRFTQRTVDRGEMAGGFELSILAPITTFKSAMPRSPSSAKVLLRGFMRKLCAQEIGEARN